MKIEFKRTGGFSPITNASGVVDFNGAAAEVTTPNGSYKRALTSEEAEKLRDLADPQKLSAPPANAKPDSVRDGFTYEVIVTTSDGKQHTLTSADLQKLGGAGAQLIKWVQQESQKILAHKAGAK